MQALKEKNDISYFPNLDGLRFFSFIVVFFAHSFATESTLILNSTWYRILKGKLFYDGDLGVSFFFVLSGFLITYLLLKEIEKTGSIDIISFYIRRALRIWPLYYFCVVFGFLLFPLLKNLFGEIPKETADPLLCSLFLNNFNTIINGPPDSSVLSVLWSVAIEEQFYLVWPILFIAVSKHNFKYIFFCIICISLTYRAFNIGGPIHLHTLSVVSDMALGGLGAFIALKTNVLEVFFNKKTKIIHLFPYACVFLLLIFRKELFHHTFVILIQRLITGTIFLWIILEQNFNNHSYFKISSLKSFSILGKYTYGLYCYHQIAILTTVTILKVFNLYNNSYQLLLLAFPLSMILTITMAYYSYHWIEKKFLEYKKNFSPKIA